jgi:hypothetical protein
MSGRIAPDAAPTKEPPMPNEQIGPFITSQVCILGFFGVLYRFSPLDSATLWGLLVVMEISGMLGAWTGFRHRRPAAAVPHDAGERAKVVQGEPCIRATSDASRTR